MRPASFQPSFETSEAPQRHRQVILILVVLLHALLLFLLLRLGPPPLLDISPTPTTVELIPDPGAAPEPSPEPEIAVRRTESAPQEKEPRAPPDTTVEPPVAPRSSIWSEVVPMTREEMAAADRAIRQSARPAQDGGKTDGPALALRGSTDDSSGPGTGPNGETLYNARWYRRPTNAELNPYVPAHWRRSGWGMVACRTVPGNRVEDCFELGQTPGSGLAGAVRQAAWQFRVMPPRIGGRPMVGEWVRIRIDYNFTEVQGPAAE